MDEWFDEVPPAFKLTFQQVVALTDEFCAKHLNDEYRDLCRDMAVALCQEGSPVRRGKLAGWACGMVYAVGWVNFLSDPGTQPHMRSEDIAAGFGVSPATMHNRFRDLREGLDLVPFDPEWCLPSRLADNPLANMFELGKGGPIVDLRMLPLQIQEQLVESLSQTEDLPDDDVRLVWTEHRGTPKLSVRRD